MKRVIASMIAVVFLGAAASPATIEEGRIIYLARCVGCHGADARGTDQAPGLAANRRVGNSSLQKPFRDIHPENHGV